MLIDAMNKPMKRFITILDRKKVMVLMLLTTPVVVSTIKVLVSGNDEATRIAAMAYSNTTDMIVIPVNINFPRNIDFLSIFVCNRFFMFPLL